MTTDRGFYLPTDGDAASVFTPDIRDNFSRTADLALNVKAYGATGDSTTDDSAAIQAAIDACDTNRGGTVFFPQGRYRLATGLTITKQGTALVGEGLPGSRAVEASGSSRIISDDGITAITCDKGSHGTLGMSFTRLHIKAATGATTGNGVLVDDIERCLFEDVTVSDYTGGYGMKFTAGGGGNTQYAQLRNFCAGSCLTGLHLASASPNGMQVFGGYFSGATTPIAGSIGIYVAAGDTLRLYGTAIQGWERGVFIETSAVGHEMFGPRFEFCNIGLHIGAGARECAIYGGSISNNLLTNTGYGNTGIQIDTGAEDILIGHTTFAGCVTDLVDNGTRTRYVKNVGKTQQGAVLGTVVGKVAQYDPDNTFLGYSPIYDNITGISFVKKLGGADATTTGITSQSLLIPAGGVPVGNTIIVAGGYGLGTSPAVSATDDSGNTYALHKQEDMTTSNTPHAAILSSTLTTALDAGDHITVTFATAVNYPIFTSYEYTGMHATRLDQTAGAHGTGTAVASGAVTTGSDNELLFAVHFFSNTSSPTFTAGSGYTTLDFNINTTKRCATESATGTTAGGFDGDGTISASNDWASVLVTFAPAT